MPTRLTSVRASVGVTKEEEKSQSVAESNYSAQVTDLFVNESNLTRIQI